MTYKEIKELVIQYIQENVGVYNKELCEEKYLIDWFHTRYGQWCGMALSLIIEDIFYQHKNKPFSWLKKIMREK